MRDVDSRNRPSTRSRVFSAPLAVPLAAVLAATLAIGEMASTADANVVEAVYGPSGIVVQYRIKFMPDLDQRRASAPGTPGLPANGSMYCVPTSAINLLAYAANHGYPGTEPGPGNWQSNARYNEATNAISTLGALMSTSASGGTNGNNAVTGLSTWLAGAPWLTWKTNWLRSNYWPTVEKIGAVACSGWIVQFAYGRYDIVGVQNGLPILDRSGGHAVTLTRINKIGTTREIGYRDPADDPANSTQSGFKDIVTPYVNLPVYIKPNTGPTFLAIVSVLGHPSTDGRYRIIDSYWAMRPILGLTFTPSAPGLPGLITKINPVPFAGSADVAPSQLAIPAGTGVLGIESHPSLNAALLVTEIPGVGRSLQTLDLFSGELAPLGDGASLAPKMVAVGRLGDIYISDGDKLYRLDDEGNLIAAISSNPPVTALAYDDSLDAVTILSVPQRRIVRFSRDLQTQLSSVLMPTNIPMTGDGSVSVNPETGRAWFYTQGAATAVGALFNADTGALNIETIAINAALTDISADRNERLRIVADGSVREYAKINGVWLIDAQSPLHGIASGPKLWLPTGRSNFVPSEHTGPGFFNIQPDQLLPIGVAVADCDADLNNDGIVDGADLGLLLTSWGAVGAGSAFDLNRDGVVDGADLGALLAAWGPCP